MGGTGAATPNTDLPCGGFPLALAGHRAQAQGGRLGFPRDGDGDPAGLLPSAGPAPTFQGGLKSPPKPSHRGPRVPAEIRKQKH